MLKDYQNKMITDYENKWPKKKWCLIASGPSLTVADVEKVRGLNVMVINDNYKLAPWADVLYAADVKWWKLHEEGISQFQGEKWTVPNAWEVKDREHFEKEYGLHFIKCNENNPGLSRLPDEINANCHGGLQAINLAYHMGAREIILLGYDMKYNRRSHWFGEHPGDKPLHMDHYNRRLKLYDKVAEDAKKMGLTIINCTRDTAITQFPQIPLDYALGNNLKSCLKSA